MQREETTHGLLIPTKPCKQLRAIGTYYEELRFLKTPIKYYQKFYLDVKSLTLKYTLYLL